MMPIIMDDTRTLAQLVADNTNGLGRLEALEATVREERNGMYVAEITVAITDKHFSDVKLGGIIKLKTPKTNQLFRIYRITRPLNGKVKIYLNHITYDLVKIPVAPFTGTGIQDVIAKLKSKSMVTHEFTMESDITNGTTKYVLDIPRSYRECLGGYEGSVLDKFTGPGSGEFEWDNTNIILNVRRGTDNGVAIEYGKQLTDVEQDRNIEERYTAAMGYVARSEKETLFTTVTHIIQSDSPRVRIIDFSSAEEFEAIEEMSDSQILNKLNELLADYIARYDITTPKINIRVSFIALADTDQYKNIAPLERVSLCDLVTVKFSKLGINTKAKVIAYTWDSILEKYIDITLGDARTNIETSIAQSIGGDIINRSVTEASSRNGEAMANLARLILNGMGMFETRVVSENGGTVLYMHNKPTLAESDIQYVVNANGFLVSTDYGATWNAGIDASGNAVLNTLDVVGLSADWMETGIIRDRTGTNYWNLDTGELRIVPTDMFIGGRNLLRGTADLKQGADFSTYGFYKSGTGTVAFNSLITNGPINAIDRGVKLTITEAGTRVGIAQKGVPVRKDTITMSVWAKGTAGDQVILQPIWSDSSTKPETGLKTFTIEETGVWTRYHFTKETDYDQSDGQARAGYVYFNSSTVGHTLEICGPQLEYGNVLTDWTPNPDDALYEIELLDDSLTQQEVFNRLTNNGATQGIYLQDGKVYINASYIQTGSLSANRISGGTLKLGGASNGNGQITVYDANDVLIGRLNNNGLIIRDNYDGTDWNGLDVNGGKAIFKFKVSGTTYTAGSIVGGSVAGNAPDGTNLNSSDGLLVQSTADGDGGVVFDTEKIQTYGKYFEGPKNFGVYCRDVDNNRYPLIKDNGTNIWIGSNQTAAKHHVGATYISAGYDKANSKGFGAPYASIPNAANDGATNYQLLHKGNFRRYTWSARNISSNGTVLTGPNLSALGSQAWLVSANLISNDQNYLKGASVTDATASAPKIKVWANTTQSDAQVEAYFYVT